MQPYTNTSTFRPTRPHDNILGPARERRRLSEDSHQPRVPAAPRRCARSPHCLTRASWSCCSWRGASASKRTDLRYSTTNPTLAAIAQKVWHFRALSVLAAAVGRQHLHIYSPQCGAKPSLPTFVISAPNRCLLLFQIAEFFIQCRGLLTPPNTWRE